MQTDRWSTRSQSRSTSGVSSGVVQDQQRRGPCFSGLSALDGGAADANPPINAPLAVRKPVTADHAAFASGLASAALSAGSAPSGGGVKGARKRD